MMAFQRLLLKKQREAAVARRNDAERAASGSKFPISIHKPFLSLPGGWSFSEAA
jgi:hypothetical protein